MLLSQVLNLEFLLVDSTLILQTGLLLPLLVEQVADDWVLTILLFQVTIVDPSKVLVLSDFFNCFGLGYRHIDRLATQFNR